MCSVSVLTYRQVIQSRVEAFSDIPIMQKVLLEKVNKVAQERFRDIDAPATIEHVEADFKEAVSEFDAVEHHVFHIKAPPSLTPSALQGPSLPLTLNQSILLHSVRSATEVLSIARAFHVKDAIRGIIPLTTERLVMHNLTRRFILNYSLKDELSKELVKVIKPLTTRVLNAHFNSVQWLRDDVEEQVLSFLQTGNSAGMNAALQESAQELMKQALSEPSGLTEEQLQDAVAKRTADLVVETYVKQVVDAYDMDAAPELSGYKRLPSQTDKTRRIFMINGGVASGKSSAQAIEAGRAKVDGVEWEDVCPINRDAFKPMLLKMSEVHDQYKDFFASFSEDEAYLLRDAILRDYKDRLITNTAPHLYIDQVSPTIEMMRLAGQPDSNGLDLTIVYTPVEASLLMAHNREKATGYVAVTKGVLNTHAGVPTQLLQSLETAQKEGCSNIRLRIVANVAPGEVVPVALIDYGKKKGVIHDMDRLLRFFHKTHINRDAEQFRDLYSPMLPSPKECCMDMVKDLTRGIEVVS